MLSAVGFDFCETRLPDACIALLASCGCALMVEFTKGSGLESAKRDRSAAASTAIGGKLAAGLRSGWSPTGCGSAAAMGIAKVSQPGSGMAGVTYTKAGIASIPIKTAVQARCRRFVSRKRNMNSRRPAMPARRIDLIEISTINASQAWANSCMTILPAMDVCVFERPRPWRFCRPSL